MPALIVPTVMAQWLTVAVPLYGIGVWGLIGAPGGADSEQFYHEIDFMCTASGQKFRNIWFIFKILPIPMPAWGYYDRYEQAINEPGVVGINIGTRPDCLPDDDWLSGRTHRTYACDRRTWLANDLWRNVRAHKPGTQLWTLWRRCCVSVRQRPRLYRIWLMAARETHEMMVENVRRCVTDNGPGN